jgi:hypothetical protein
MTNDNDDGLDIPEFLRRTPTSSQSTLLKYVAASERQLISPSEAMKIMASSLDPTAVRYRQFQEDDKAKRLAASKITNAKRKAKQIECNGFLSIPKSKRRWDITHSRWVNVETVTKVQPVKTEPVKVVSANDEAEFLTALKSLGGKSGNTTFQAKLKWKEERYRNVRDNLLSKKTIITGRGRGGSVIVNDGTPVSIPIAAPVMVYKPDLNDDDETVFIQFLQKNMGGKSGNVTMRRQLNWSDERYWTAQKALVQQNKIGLGMGRGGTVYLK